MSAAAAQLARGREVSGVAIRVALGLATVGLFLAVILGSGLTLSWFYASAAVIGTVATVRYPDSVAPAGTCLFAVVLYGFTGPGFGVVFVVAASLLHTVHVLASLADLVPRRARAEALALAPVARRWGRAQLVTVPLLVVLAAVL